MIDPIDVLGLVAGGFSTFALAPQALKIGRSKKVDQLSLPMLFLMIVGASLWLTYGIVQDDLAIIVANAIALMFQGYMITMCFVHK